MTRALSGTEHTHTHIHTHTHVTLCYSSPPEKNVIPVPCSPKEKTSNIVKVGSEPVSDKPLPHTDILELSLAVWNLMTHHGGTLMANDMGSWLETALVHDAGGGDGKGGHVESQQHTKIQHHDQHLEPYTHTHTHTQKTEFIIVITTTTTNLTIIIFNPNSNDHKDAVLHHHHQSQ